nr:agamous-like MADS-box protein AGL61 [Ipomoea batatas]
MLKLKPAHMNTRLPDRYEGFEGLEALRVMKALTVLRALRIMRNLRVTRYVAESENRTIEGNVTEKLLRSQKEADIRLANHQINVLEAAIQHEMKVNEALTEAAKGMPSISNLPLAELLSMKRQMEILRSNVFQILNPQPTMPVQTQGMTTQSDDVNPSGATPF